MNKIYKCDVCGKVLTYKPIRLVKQKYGIGTYKQYSTVCHYDFCKECYAKVEHWILKRKGD